MISFALENADRQVKMITLVGLAATVCGFAIVTFFEGSYGFISANPFRAKILSAGLLFGVIVFLVYMCSFGAYGLGTNIETAIVAVPVEGHEDVQALSRWLLVLPHRFSCLALNLSLGMSSTALVLTSTADYFASYSLAAFLIVSASFLLSTISILRKLKKRWIGAAGLLAVHLRFWPSGWTIKR